MNLQKFVLSLNENEKEELLSILNNELRSKFSHETNMLKISDLLKMDISQRLRIFLCDIIEHGKLTYCYEIRKSHFQKTKGFGSRTITEFNELTGIKF